MDRVIGFVKEAYWELKKVSWPTRDQVVNYTLTVIGVSVAVAIFLGILDMIFSFLMEKIIF